MELKIEEIIVRSIYIWTAAIIINNLLGEDRKTQTTTETNN